ncbi:MAG: hypothetical protein M0C28_07115 [Candidatus Moduliflexus flocculans]|nr:hypothetical protein [Candidatus Moduliflexus flocculans]
MDAAKVRLTEATVLALYLLPESLETLSPRLRARPRARRPHRLPRLRDPGLGEAARPERGPDRRPAAASTRSILYRMPGRQ